MMIVLNMMGKDIGYWLLVIGFSFGAETAINQQQNKSLSLQGRRRATVTRQTVAGGQRQPSDSNCVLQHRAFMHHCLSN